MKKQTIGFDRELDLAWLDLTAGLAGEGLSLPEIRGRLTDRLASTIPGTEACRKTITVMTRIWIRIEPAYQPLQAEALSLLPRVSQAERLWLHWGMSLLAFPFFFDVATVVGRLLRLQERCQSGQVQRRMREGWGERSTLERAVSRLLKTFTAWQVLQTRPDDRYTYHALPPQQTANSGLALWFADALLQSSRRDHRLHDRQLPLADLLQSPAGFPFDLAAHATTLRQADRFRISRQGLDLEIVAAAVDTPVCPE